MGVKIRTLPTKRTTTTTTVRPRSLADLFKIRNGQKITKEEEVPEQLRKSPLNNSSRNNNSNNNRGNKQSTIQKLKNRLDKFRPKKASTTKSPATTTTTTASTKSSSFQKQKKRPKTVKDILASIPVDDALPPSSLLPKGFKPQGPPGGNSKSKSSPGDSVFSTIQQDDISKFLPPGF